MPVGMTPGIIALGTIIGRGIPGILVSGYIIDSGSSPPPAIIRGSYPPNAWAWS
jgi:hypothetical protein